MERLGELPDEVFDVEFRGVTKRFGSLTAVNGVSFQVRQGEFLSLLGPSGCGKTTSLRMIAGFEQPDEGEILIGGIDAVGTPPYKRNVNTVFQQYALFPHMSILDNVAYGMKQKRCRQDRALRPGPRGPGAGPADRARQAQARRCCPAVSSSASRWPGPWSTAPACCSSTSRSAPST